MLKKMRRFITDYIRVCKTKKLKVNVVISKCMRCADGIDISLDSIKSDEVGRCINLEFF